MNGRRGPSAEEGPRSISGEEGRAGTAAAHTAEHILSAVMRHRHGSPRPLETHLDGKKAKCDYAVRGPLGEAALRAIEAAVNAEIDADHAVSARLVSVEEAEGRFDLAKVPRDADRVRLIRIVDLDECPCAGEHVQRTSEIGRFEIASAEMTTAERVRIRFRLRPPSDSAA